MPGPGWALGKIYSYSGSKPESGLCGVSSRPTGSRFLPSSFKCLSEAPSFSVFSLNNPKNGSTRLQSKSLSGEIFLLPEEER